MQNQLRNPQNPLKKQVQEQLHKKQIDEVKLVGHFATIANLAMYISYLGEIIANLNGQPTSSIQPLFAALNATLWVGYGWLMPKEGLAINHCKFPRRHLWGNGGGNGYDVRVRKETVRSQNISTGCSACMAGICFSFARFGTVAS